tara:strand:+ start:2267 stop:2899 length:633 start_codon:yes stop_codon:yes gene_type:complete
MSNDINSAFGGAVESSYYSLDETKKDKPTFIPAVPGEYLGHIVELKSKVYDIKGGVKKARIYNYYVQLAEQNAGTKYEVPNHGTIDGSEFTGRKIRSDGVFRYLEPQEGDTFQSHPAGNTGYLKFCEAIGVELKPIEKTIDGKKVKLLQLPSISEEDVLGKAVKINVQHGKSYKNAKGYDTVPLVIKFINIWKDGKDIVIKKESTDDIPF